MIGNYTTSTTTPSKDKVFQSASSRPHRSDHLLRDSQPYGLTATRDKYRRAHDQRLGVLSRRQFGSGTGRWSICAGPASWSSSPLSWPPRRPITTLPILNLAFLRSLNSFFTYFLSLLSSSPSFVESDVPPPVVLSFSLSQSKFLNPNSLLPITRVDAIASLSTVCTAHNCGTPFRVNKRPP